MAESSPPSESGSSGNEPNGNGPNGNGPNGNGPSGKGSDGSQSGGQYGSASSVRISLSQAILAPLDAIFKSQVHAARSFLNFLQQLGYPHRSEGGSPPGAAGQNDGGNGGGTGNSGGTEGAGADRPETSYTIDFLNEVTLEGGKREVQKISIPALALVPVAPLAVEKARYTFDLEIVEVQRHRQLRLSEAQDKGMSDEDRQKRPWNLVDEPLSLRGSFTPKEDGGASGTDRRSRIHVEIDVGRIPKPAALDKLLTSLGQMSGLDPNPPEAQKASPGASAEESASAEDASSEEASGENASDQDATDEDAPGEDATDEDTDRPGDAS